KCLQGLSAVPAVSLVEAPRIVLTAPSLASVEIVLRTSFGDLAVAGILNCKELGSQAADISTRDKHSAQEREDFSIMTFVSCADKPFQEHPLTLVSVDLRDHEQWMPVRREATLDPGFGGNTGGAKQVRKWWRPV